MSPEQDAVLDRIAFAGWKPGPAEWAVVRVMTLLEELFRESNRTAADPAGR
jgi:hypothetical protein